MRADQKTDTRIALLEEKELERERIRMAIDAGYLSPPWYFDVEADAPSIVPEPREQDPVKPMMSM
jgi:hypothetical protein